MSLLPRAHARADERIDVLVVGGMRLGLGDEQIGGQMFACRSLIESRLGSIFRLHCINSSSASIKSASNTFARVPVATGRLIRVIWMLLRLQRPRCLFFCGNGFSFFDKGLMTFSARALGCRVLLLPRSGHLRDQVARTPWFRAYVRLVLQRASLVVCQSESWRAYFQELAGGRGRFEVVENWLADGAFVSDDADVARSGGPDFVVGFFNRIEHAKGIFDFLEAVRLAAMQVSHLRAVIYGDGNAVEPMRSWIRAHDLESKIEYRGWLGAGEKAAALRRLDAYAFTSTVEGFPNSLLEVLALKIPVISVRVGAVSDVLEDGESAVLTPVGDIRALVDALVRMAADPGMREKFANNAHARVRKLNTLERAVAYFEENLR